MLFKNKFVKNERLILCKYEKHVLQTDSDQNRTKLIMEHALNYE